MPSSQAQATAGDFSVVKWSTDSEMREEQELYQGMIKKSQI